MGTKYVVTVAADGALFLDGTALDVAALLAAVESGVRKTSQPATVCMHVDRAATCGVALELFFALRAMEGVQSVDFDVESTA